MKTRPIIFSGFSVRAIQADRKTQSRRIIKPQPPAGADTHIMAADGSGDVKFFSSPASGIKLARTGWIRCPYGIPGDRLWVRETFHIDNTEYVKCYQAEPWMGDPDPDNAGIFYRADPANNEAGCIWRSPRFMPRWASRLTLGLTDVRVERIQDISEADAVAEGVDVTEGQVMIAQAFDECRPDLPRIAPAQQAFSERWDSLHAKPKPSKRNPYTGQPERCKVSYPWDSVREETIISARKSSSYYGCKVYIVGNPSVFPLTFERIEE